MSNGLRSDVSRTYGYLTDEELRAEAEVRDREMAEKDAEMTAHLSIKPVRGNDLAHSHAGLLISREALALSQDRYEIHVETEMRKQGLRKRLD
jgi:hypothetical protein